ncbi:MAG: carboxypeptidase regulatory-like domain-containing protein, partial [Chitinophagaceae bacterium]|nr:carboxypeptidase regulatory-like domain-containing protein [Chitinophagaceae bacterium]
IHFQLPSTASVGNYVWLDINQDGIQDPSEEGISGVTVTLCNVGGTVIATTITDADGLYLFTNVIPGIYSVGFTKPVGLIFSPNNGLVTNGSNSDANPSTGKTNTFTVNAGDEITTIDAGLFSQATTQGGLGDKVWYDTDQDGVQDPEENGVADVSVSLCQADGVTLISSTTTDAYGNYVFNNLPAGQYTVGFSTLPLGYIFTTDTGLDSATNSNANPTTGKTQVINLAQGQFNMTIDAGIHTTIPANTNSLGNYVWYDVDKDGIQGASEIGVAGVTVKLFDNTNTELKSTSTNQEGLYLFPDLPNGDYYVGFSNLPLGYIFSNSNAGTDLIDSDPNIETGLTASVSLVGNTHDRSLDAGINLGNIKIGKATLGDKVWYDINNDGLQDTDELGVPNVTVNLCGEDGVTILATTKTDALGNYIFTGLDAGTYGVAFGNLPAGFTVSPKNSDAQGLNGEANSDVNAGTLKTDLIILGVGEDNMNLDLGIVPPAGTASLGNLVWFDLNNDGLQTAEEPGVQGVSVTLCDIAGLPLKTTSTDANGEYYFVGLLPDTYAVKFSNLPIGYSFTTQDADLAGINGANNSDANDTSGKTNTVTLVSGDNNPRLDAGIVSTIVASVGDYVWFDENRNGIQDPTEAPVAGVLVTLYDNTNTPVASAITKPDGSYIFTNVTPGDYTIGFSNTPAGMDFTTQESNPISNAGSNANPSTGITPSFTVLAGTHTPSIDAGLFVPLLAGLGNYVWIDANENGLQEANEVPVAGVIVTLYGSDGSTVLATAATDGMGAYSFTNLEAGTYVVGFSNLPLGYT